MLGSRGQRLSTLTTSNCSLTYTVAGVPSLLTMCASYFAFPSASVSTRTIVAPLTSAFAAASTFEAVSPVRSVSSGRRPPHCWPPLGAPCGAGADCGVVVVVVAAAAPDEDEDEDPPAALA